MKRFLKSTLAMLLAAVMLAGAAPALGLNGAADKFSITAAAEGEVVYNPQDPIEAAANTLIDRIRDRIREKFFGEKFSYGSVITFYAEPSKTPVSGGEFYWYINNQEMGRGDRYTAEALLNNYNVQVKYVKDGVILAESGVKNIRISFFSRLIYLISFNISYIVPGVSATLPVNYVNVHLSLAAV